MLNHIYTCLYRRLFLLGELHRDGHPDHDGRPGAPGGDSTHGHRLRGLQVPHVQLRAPEKLGPAAGGGDELHGRSGLFRAQRARGLLERRGESLWLPGDGRS